MQMFGKKKKQMEMLLWFNFLQGSIKYDWLHIAGKNVDLPHFSSSFAMS